MKGHQIRVVLLKYSFRDQLKKMELTEFESESKYMKNVFHRVVKLLIFSQPVVWHSGAVKENLVCKQTETF